MDIAIQPLNNLGPVRRWVLQVPSVSTGAQITKYNSNKRQETKQLQIKTNPKWPKIQSFPVPVERPLLQ